MWQFGVTPLVSAVAFGHPAVVRVLLDAGVDKNEKREVRVRGGVRW